MKIVCLRIRARETTSSDVIHTELLHHTARIAIALQYFTLLTNSTDAFFPTPWKEKHYGKGGVSHIQQTDQVFEVLAAKYFPTITKLTKTMIKAKKTIHDANAAVDKNQDLSELHFDGENFGGGQTRLTTLKTQVIESLQSGKADDARKALGGALHTVQDFYAHTNWVELGNLAISADLGRGNPIAHAAFGDTTCRACGPHNPLDGTDSSCLDCSGNEDGFSLLTSGYYFGEDSPPPPVAIPANKCHHGGATDNPHGATFGVLLGDPLGGINKDSLNCVYSPHFASHPTAVQFSIDATTQYIDDIKAELSESELRLLFGVGPTFAFVIDTTGSMADIISSVKDQSIAIVTERLGTPDEPSTYVVSPFNDPTTGPDTVTSDFDTFKTAISGLGASGGGDCPEDSLQGMLDAIDVMDEGSSLFMMTDAAPKDADLAAEVISMANEKDINIYPFKFDSACDDGLIAKRQDSLSNSIYGSIAAATGGQYHSLPRSEVGSITGLLDTLTKGDSGFVLKIADTADSATPLSYKFPVDSSMTEVTISLRGVGVSMAITQPDGSSLSLSGTGVSSTILSDGQFVTVKSPAVGEWAIEVTGTGSFTLDVTGVSSLHFSSFDFVEIAGRPGHTGYFPIDGPPAYDHDVAAIGVIDGDFSGAAFDLRSPAGAVLINPVMDPGSGEYGDAEANSYFGEMRLTPGSLFVYATGQDAAGNPFQRVLSSVITPFLSNTMVTGINDAFPTVVFPDTNSTNTTTSSAAAPFTNSTTVPTFVTTPTPPVSRNSSTSRRRFTTTSDEYADTVTVITYTTTTVCPVTTHSSTVSGKISYFVSESISTVTLTSTSIIPCAKCTGPNYPQNTASGYGGTVTIITYITTTTCPVTTGSTTISGKVSYLVSESISTVTLTSTSTIPCAKCTGPNPPHNTGGYNSAGYNSGAHSTGPGSDKMSSGTYPSIATSGSHHNNSTSVVGYQGPMATGGAEKGYPITALITWLGIVMFEGVVMT